jgi:hypothetical protein
MGAPSPLATHSLFYFIFHFSFFIFHFFFCFLSFSLCFSSLTLFCFVLAVVLQHAPQPAAHPQIQYIVAPPGQPPQTQNSFQPNSFQPNSFQPNSFQPNRGFNRQNRPPIQCHYCDGWNRYKQNCYERLADVTRGCIRNKSSDPDPTATKKRSTADDLSADILKKLKRLDDFEQKEKLVLEQVRISSFDLPVTFHTVCTLPTDSETVSCFLTLSLGTCGFARPPCPCFFLFCLRGVFSFPHRSFSPLRVFKHVFLVSSIYSMCVFSSLVVFVH